jgi:hypothetical protein
MKTVTLRYALFVVPALAVLAFVALIELTPHSLARAAAEDGPIESLTALCFAAAAGAFAYAAWRTPSLHNSGVVWAPAMTVCWALLMALALGEEISWGQRIFGIVTPPAISAVNTQDEINLHNIDWVNNLLGGTYRWMSVYLLMMGLGVPLLALTKWGRALFGFFRFPVSPWCYSVVFLGAYFYGIFYRVWFPVPDLQPPNTPTEVREFLLALGSAFFAVHTALWPADVYVDPPVSFPLSATR